MKEVKAEDDIYVFMMSSDSHSNGLGSPSIEEPPGVCLEIQKKKGINPDAEPKEYNEEGMVEKEEVDKLEENAFHLRNSRYSLYSSILRDVPEAKSENISFSEGPPLPPRNQFLASKQSECFYLYSALKKVEGQVEKKGTEGEPKINDYSDEIDEEDPYTSAVLNDGVYDAIMENRLQEQRKDGRSFIMNRPPAPAPRPLSTAVREESTSYIAQVFKQKVTSIHAGNEKLLNAIRKPGTPMTTKFNESELIKEMAMKLNDRSYEDKITYTTVKPKIPPRQEEHILFQQQLKKGNSSMDEMQKPEHWQIHTSSPETTQQVMEYFKEQLNTHEETGL